MDLHWLLAHEAALYLHGGLLQTSYHGQWRIVHGTGASHESHHHFVTAVSQAVHGTETLGSYSSLHHTLDMKTLKTLLI